MQQQLLDLLSELIKRPSVTPTDAGCQDFMAAKLTNMGFTCERFNKGKISNLWARIGHTKPLLAFAGHTDVVATGPIDKWQTPPFTATIKDGMVYGRGVADMKGSLAAMLYASECFLAKQPTFAGSLAFLITSGEEGDDFEDGTPYVMEQLAARGEHIDYCVLGEPSSTNTVGDVIKIGRRGSLTGRVTIEGKQGHVAYPQMADNAIHRLAPMLNALVATEWDQGNEAFPPTTLQVTECHAGVGQSNVIPGDCYFQFNFRYSTATSAKELQQRVEAIFAKHGTRYHCQWQVNGLPFLTDKGRLIDACKAVIKDSCAIDALCSTTGGTSDGRFIAPYGVELVELGPVNATIHQIDESLSVDALSTLCILYLRLCEKLLKDKE